MKPISNILTSLICILFFIGCNKKPPIRVDRPINYTENYKFFPIVDGREWNYEVTEVDSTKGTTKIIKELARYSEDDLRTNYYENGILKSWAFWLNNNNKMECCGGKVLIDYNELDCFSDSVLIYKSKIGNAEITIHQYCEKKFALEVPNFNKIECIKTKQLNKNTSGNYLRIIHYFGYGVGLIYTQETYFDKSGKILTQKTQKLVSRNF